MKNIVVTVLMLICVANASITGAQDPYGTLRHLVTLVDESQTSVCEVGVWETTGGRESLFVVRLVGKCPTTLLATTIPGFLMDEGEIIGSSEDPEFNSPTYPNYLFYRVRWPSFFGKEAYIDRASKQMGVWIDGLLRAHGEFIHG